MTTTKSFEVDDKLIIAGHTDTLWRVHQVTPVLNGDETVNCSIGLVDTENPRNGTAFYGDVLAPLVIDHIKSGDVRAEVTLVLESDERDPQLLSTKVVAAYADPDAATDDVNAFNATHPVGHYRSTQAVTVIP